jgi:hypothetical protein
MITVKINIPDTDPFVLTQNDYIKGFNLLYEVDSDIEKIYSAISANELNLTLINKGSVFSLENTESPLYGKIKNGTELEVFETLSGEPISRGKFYIVDYDAPLNAMGSSFSIRAVDKLQAVLNKDVSLEQISRSLSMYDYFLQIFSSLGFKSEDLLIDEDLKSIFLNFSIFNGKKMAEILNSCCKASDCMIFVDSMGRINIKEKKMVGSPVKHFTTSNIVSLDISKSLTYDYNLLKMGYVAANISENTELLKCTLSCPVGVNDFKDLEMSKANVFDIDSVMVSCSSDIDILGCSYSQKLFTLSVDNLGSDEVDVDLFVLGRTIDTTTAYITTKNDEDIALNGNKSLDITSESIQDPAYAQRLSTIYWGRLNEHIPYIQLKTRSNSLQFMPCMIVDVKEPVKAKLDYLGYIHSVKYEWNGGDAFSVDIGIKSAKEVDSNE